MDGKILDFGIRILDLRYCINFEMMIGESEMAPPSSIFDQPAMP
jgi:hypothetical protein